MTSDGKFRYTYDNEGNRISKICLTSGEKTVYNWDHRNRLVGVTAGTGRKKREVRYRYDYLNRLTIRNDEYFVHDGWQIVLTLDKAGKVKEKFLWGAKQDELLCENEDFVFCDHLGTIRKVINNAGKTVAELEYDAFGRVISHTGVLSRFRYTGKMTDDETGLQWNINRWYDVSVGKWISEDPIGFVAQDANLSRYVANRSILRLDQLGLIDSSNFIIRYAKIIASDQITFDKSGEGDFETCNLNLIIAGNLAASDVGREASSPIHIKYKIEKDSVTPCKYRINFRVAGCAFAIVLPVDDNTLSFWRNYISHHSNWIVIQAFNFSSPPTEGEVNVFQAGVIKHENNHVNPFEEASHSIWFGLGSRELQEFDDETEADATLRR